MVLTRVSIKRPVLATVISLLIIVLGLGSMLRLPVREYPDVDDPTVSVTTVYPGASAEVVERDVTQEVEAAVGTISGISMLTSTSRDEVSQVNIEFTLDRDLDAAAADVRDKLGEVRAELPDDAEDPIISKTAADAQATMWVTITSEQRDRLELTDFAERNLVDPLSIVPGVADVIIGGARRYAMRIWLDPAAMAARGVTVDDVAETLRRENVELPAGRIESEERELTVRTDTRLSEPAAFRDLVVREAEGTQITLGDVARVEIGAESYRTGVRTDGEPSVGLGIIRQSRSNTLAVTSGVREELERLRDLVPDDISVDVAFDESIFIEGSIRQVSYTLAITAVLVIAVIFIFLRSLRTTLIPAATIPVSLIGTFIVLYAFGYSINTLTLLALVLAIGMVVDDSIVVIENIYRHNEMGEPKLLAAARGGDQIGFAVIATTLVLIAVFVPLTFLTGTVGRLFTQFGVALSAAVAFSSLVALTLGAMLSSKLVSAGQERQGRFFRATEKGFDAVNRGYSRTLERVVAVPWLMVGGALILSGLAYVLYVIVPEELTPTEDRGVFIIPIEAPQGASYEYTSDFVGRVENIIKPLIAEDGPAERAISIIGPSLSGPAPTNEAFIIVRLKDWGERDRSQQAIVDELRPKILSLPGARAFVVNPPSLGQENFSQPVQFAIGGPTYDAAYDWAQQILARARDVPGLINPDLDYEETRPQLELTVNRSRAADLGIDVRQIGEALQILLGGQDITEYVERGETYEVMVQAAPEARMTPEALNNVYVRAEGDDLVSLRSLVEMRTVGAPAALKRVNQQPAVTLTASLTPDAALGDVLARLNSIAAEELPAAARISYRGQSQDYQEASGAIYLTFALALLIVFLVLAGQFESFIHPAVIMVAVPLAITGGLAALALTGITLNIFSQIGLILLIGLMAKNGILIVEFANQRRDAGLELRDAVIEAATVRLRPIVMTSVATLFGALPLALAVGPGAEGRSAIGVVIIGGIIVATLMTLYIVPVLYLLLGRFTRPAGAIAQRLEELEAGETQPKPAPERKREAAE